MITCPAHLGDSMVYPPASMASRVTLSGHLCPGHVVRLSGALAGLLGSAEGADVSMVLWVRRLVGHLEVLSWLREHDCPWVFILCVHAVVRLVKACRASGGICSISVQPVGEFIVDAWSSLSIGKSFGYWHCVRVTVRLCALCEHDLDGHDVNRRMVCDARLAPHLGSESTAAAAAAPGAVQKDPGYVRWLWCPRGAAPWQPMSCPHRPMLVYQTLLRMSLLSVEDVEPLHRGVALAGGSLRTSTRTKIGRACMTHLQGECSNRRAEEEEEIRRRSGACSQ
jgi:hypothetical protein